MTMKFVIPGTPVGKGRPRFTRNGHTYTPEKTRAYEALVQRCWREQCGGICFHGTPIEATVYACFPIPQSLSKKKRAELAGEPHTKKPDLDNVLKAVFDALNGFAYEDDALIYKVEAEKYYSDFPRVEVTLKTEGVSEDEC